jgi:hypothetical protein
MPLSTVSAILHDSASGGPTSQLAPTNRPNRDERRHPGEPPTLGRIARPGHRVSGENSQRGWQRRRLLQDWDYAH